jgi:P-loop containing dynein motor region
VGESGTAKTTVIQKYLSSLPDSSYSRMNVNFSSRTTSADVQTNIEAHIDKRSGAFMAIFQFFSSFIVPSLPLYCSSFLSFLFLSHSFFLSLSLSHLISPLFFPVLPGAIYGPAAGKKLIVFIDDLNMPKVDTYGTQQPIALLHFLIGRGNMYDRGKDLNLKVR